jgi:hypothetical protein
LACLAALFQLDNWRCMLSIEPTPSFFQWPKGGRWKTSRFWICPCKRHNRTSRAQNDQHDPGILGRFLCFLPCTMQRSDLSLIFLPLAF